MATRVSNHSPYFSFFVWRKWKMKYCIFVKYWLCYQLSYVKVDAQDDESYGDFSGALPTCWWPSVISKQRWKYLIPGMISHVQLSTSTYCSSSLLGPRLITIHYMYNNIKMFLSLAVFRYFAFVLAQINMSLESY